MPGMFAKGAIWAAAITLFQPMFGGALTRAQSVILAESMEPGQCQQVRLELTVKGTLKVPRGEMLNNLPLQAKAEQAFSERLLAGGVPGQPMRAARRYETAKATITVDGVATQRKLRDERRLMIYQRQQGVATHYSPAGALMREELELIGEHLDTLAIPSLLPGKEVKVGDTWDVPNFAVQALCDLEGLENHSIAGTLQAWTDGTATLAFSGKATGVQGGSAMKIEINGRAKFDTNSRQVVELRWAQHDQREAGPASPASEVDAEVVVTRVKIEKPMSLDDGALAAAPMGFDLPASSLLLEYKDPQKRFEVLHERGWTQVTRTQNHLVMRLMDQGDFLAQATITQWANAGKGRHQSAEEFQGAIRKIPGWDQAEVLSSGEMPSGDRRWIYRHAVAGKLDGVEVLQTFYLIAGPDGDQVVVTVTCTPKLATKIAGRDQVLVTSLEFPMMEEK